MVISSEGRGFKPHPGQSSVGPFPLLGLTLTRDILGTSKHSILPLNYLDLSWTKKKNFHF